jgi:hypothetical protein
VLCKKVAQPTQLVLVFDLRGEPTLVCICGSKMWNLKVMWDIETRQVGMYLLDQVCTECGAMATAPTEIDACD